ncbi:hypothetical protein QL285_014541 [Trifolium repens]|nr:hypothetical protein QL285_014541 [Trifolium repens]
MTSSSLPTTDIKLRALGMKLKNTPDTHFNLESHKSNLVRAWTTQVSRRCTQRAEELPHNMEIHMFSRPYSREARCSSSINTHLTMWDFVGEVAQFEQKAHPGGLAAARG